MEQRGLLRRGLLLEYVTLGWNAVGVIILVLAAYAARSVALAGFGLDSLIEIFASMVVVWHLLGIHRNRERLALWLIGIAFLFLVAYIAVQVAYTLFTHTHPEPSIGGIVWTAMTCIAMLSLAYGKSVTGERMSNEVLKTEARVTHCGRVPGRCCPRRSGPQRTGWLVVGGPARFTRHHLLCS